MEEHAYSLVSKGEFETSNIVNSSYPTSFSVKKLTPRYCL